MLLMSIAYRRCVINNLSYLRELCCLAAAGTAGRPRDSGPTDAAPRRKPQLVCSDATHRGADVTCSCCCFPAACRLG